MMYKIQLYYATGDSFESENVNKEIELSWENLDIAKENLKRIKEHYICYLVDQEYSGKKSRYFNSLTDEQKLMYDLRTQQPWYPYPNEKNAPYHYSIKLIADNGNVFQISTFWCGYFEHLYSAEIITDNSEMKITF